MTSLRPFRTSNRRTVRHSSVPSVSWPGQPSTDHLSGIRPIDDFAGGITARHRRRVARPAARGGIRSGPSRRPQIDPLSQSTFGGRLRVWLRSPDYRLIDQAAIRLVSAVERLGAIAEGPIPLPAELEPDNGRIHVRQIDIVATTRDIIETLANLDLPAGVSISMAG